MLALTFKRFIKLGREVYTMVLTWEAAVEIDVEAEKYFPNCRVSSDGIIGSFDAAYPAFYGISIFYQNNVPNAVTSMIALRIASLKSRGHSDALMEELVICDRRLRTAYHKWMAVREHKRIRSLERYVQANRPGVTRQELAQSFNHVSWLLGDEYINRSGR